MSYKTTLFLAECALTGLIALAGDVIVAVNVNTPGLYGQIVLGGGLPTPELIMPRPTIVVAAPVAEVAPEPLYLHVPPGYERHWAKHCREYNACERPVYFVSDRWYHDVYTPHRMSHHDEERRDWDRHDDHDRGHWRDHDEHEHGHDHDRGRGHDHDDHDHDR